MCYLLKLLNFLFKVHCSYCYKTFDEIEISIEKTMCAIIYSINKVYAVTLLLMHPCVNFIMTESNLTTRQSTSNRVVPHL